MLGDTNCWRVSNKYSSQLTLSLYSNSLTNTFSPDASFFPLSRTLVQKVNGRINNIIFITKQMMCRAAVCWLKYPVEISSHSIIRTCCCNRSLLLNGWILSIETTSSKVFKVKILLSSQIFLFRNNKWMIDNHIKSFYSLIRHAEFSEAARWVSI